MDSRCGPEPLRKRNEKKTEIETRYLSNVLLWFALMVFLINLFNNSMEKNPGIYIFCLVACAIGV